MTKNDHKQARLALKTLRLYSEYDAESDDLKESARTVLTDYLNADPNADSVGGGPVGRDDIDPNDVNEPHA